MQEWQCRNDSRSRNRQAARSRRETAPVFPRQPITVFSVLLALGRAAYAWQMMSRKHDDGMAAAARIRLCRPAWAEIYAYTADDGAVSLSNVPTDPRYTV